jgi:plastocyanin
VHPNRSVLVPVLFLGVAMVACQAGSEDGTEGGADETTVEVRLTCDSDDPDAPCVFDPAEVTIPPGGTVRWVNAEAVFHTVTSADTLDVRTPNGLFDVVLDEQGETFSRRFPEAGTFPYYCQPHSEFMTGTVRVREP